MKHITSEICAKKNYSIEFLRILFAVLIVHFHLFHANIQSYVQWADWQTRFFNTWHSMMFVDAFCIISGFFLYNTVNSQTKVSFVRFAFRRFARLWPIFAFAMICLMGFGAVGLYFMQNGFQTFLNLMFMQCNGLSIGNYCNGITWFVSPFFFGLLFYFGLIKSVDKKVSTFIVALLVYFGYVIFANSGLNAESMWGAKMMTSFINMGMVRICAGIGAGYLVAVLYNHVKDNNIFTNLKYRKLNFILFSILEILLICVIIHRTVFLQMEFQNLFVFIPMFVMLVFAFAMQQGIISKITNHKISAFMGRYAYSIYIMQQIAFILLGLTLWKCTEFVNANENLTVFLSLVFAVILGMVVYHIIELPALRFAKRLEQIADNSDQKSE